MTDVKEIRDILRRASRSCAAYPNWLRRIDRPKETRKQALESCEVRLEEILETLEKKDKGSPVIFYIERALKAIKLEREYE